jgi:hypothetical protein
MKAEMNADYQDKQLEIKQQELQEKIRSNKADEEIRRKQEAKKTKESK